MKQTDVAARGSSDNDRMLDEGREMDRCASTADRT